MSGQRVYEALRCQRHKPWNQLSRRKRTMWHCAFYYAVEGIPSVIENERLRIYGEKSKGRLSQFIRDKNAEIEQLKARLEHALNANLEACGCRNALRTSATEANRHCNSGRPPEFGARDSSCCDAKSGMVLASLQPILEKTQEEMDEAENDNQALQHDFGFASDL